MHAYSSLSDDFYSNMNLNTEMALPNNRETVLGFLERVRNAPKNRRAFRAPCYKSTHCGLTSFVFDAADI